MQLSEAVDLWDYIKNLFCNEILFALSTFWGIIAAFVFPESAFLTAAGAVLVIMLIDLLTKIFALSKQAGGFFKALKTRKITSAKFLKGTSDKFIVLIIMLVIGGCAYRISPIAELATWFMQVIFTLMFLRDVLSIIENLSDAGVSGLGIFKKKIKSKFDEVCGNDSSSDDASNGGT